jgi:hypothetical protein
VNVLAFEAPKKAIVEDNEWVVRVCRSDEMQDALSRFRLEHGPVILPKFCTLNGEAMRFLRTAWDSYVFKRFESVIDGVAAIGLLEDS